jgi:FkbM family methyltransferase
MSVLLRLLRVLPRGLRRRLSLLQMRGPVGRWLSSRLTRLLRNRDMTILGGAAAGARINLGGSYLQYLSGDVETVVQDALSQVVKPGQVVYDIGANIGFFTIICARLVGPNGRVYAFEPMPESAVTLRHNVALNSLDNTVVVEKAASSADGRAELLVSEWSAFHALKAEGISPPERARGAVEVETIALDNFASDGDGDSPDVVKIDVEGAELEVIKGMAALLASKRPLLICELHGTNADFVRLIEANGYQAIALGDDKPLVDAHWNAHAVAWPRGKQSPV